MLWLEPSCQLAVASQQGTTDFKNAIRSGSGSYLGVCGGELGGVENTL